MLGTWLYSTALAALPVLDPLLGSTVSDADRDLLPSGAHTASLADLWLPEVVSLDPGMGGAITLFDQPLLSTYGFSWTQTRFMLNGIDVSDPARPGSPLIELPHGFWNRTTFASLWSERPCWGWTVAPDASGGRIDAQASWGESLGGSTWVPRHFMDREPALFAGASKVRRALVEAREVEAKLERQGHVLAVEHLQHPHRYPTLRSAGGGLVDDDAARTTVMVVGNPGPISYALVWQGLERTHAGAENRWPLPLTRQQSSDAFVGQVGTRLVSAKDLIVDGRLGFGFRDESLRPHTQAPIVSDLEDEWFWLARPAFGEHTRRSRVDLSLDAGIGEQRMIGVTFVGSIASLASQARIPGGLTGTTFMRGETPQERAVSMAVYDRARVAEEWLEHFRLAGSATPRWRGLEISAVAALDYAGAAVNNGLALQFLTPAFGLAAQRRLGDSRLFLFVRREPEALTAEASSFADSARPSGNRYQWTDDGDLVPEPGEAGTLLARFGGDSHRLDPHLRRPTSNALAVGWQSPRFGPFRAVITGATRLLFDRFTVRMVGPAAQSYELVHDPGATAPRLAGTDEGLRIYAREPGTAGSEIYALTNASKPNYYVGSEIQLVTEGTTHWFLSLGASAYWNIGSTPFGIYATRNDSGIIDEVTADPNARVNQRGRVDACRAFGVKLIAGVRPTTGLTATALVRYRDGEPTTRFFVAEDLPQGPTVLMAVPRGDPVPRFTFQMTVDARVRYDLDLGGLRLAAILDLFNILGSGTEMTEDDRTGSSFRRALEMVPGRAMLLTLEAGWDLAGTQG